MDNTSRPLAIPLESLVAVTGANGLVGSFVVDELLKFGYRVRGSVRDAKKHAWMTRYFGGKYGEGKLELMEVKDVAATGALDALLEGCSGFAHIASDVSFGADPNIVVNNSIAQLRNVLETAAKHPSIKRIVMTSSSSACNLGHANEEFDITPNTWNEECVKRAWAPPPYTPERALDTYSASKTQCEQFLFNFVKDNKVGYAVNSVLPDFVTGAPFAKEQGFPSSVGIARSLWDGQTMGMQMIPAQYMIDAGDVGKMHVAGLANPEVESERIFGYGHPKTWTEWIPIWKEMYPEVKFPDPPANEGNLLAKITARPRTEELLKWVDGKGLRPMKESMKDLGDACNADFLASKEA